MSTILGTTLSGRYRLEARIGAGGMSTVYRALDETLQRQVAVKLMNREVASDSDQLERFRREARAVAQLSHPHIVGVIDAGEDEGRPYIVLEFVEGETLKERIRRLGRLPIAEAVAYAIEIARALGAAHARHIVHRDVKPQNVLVDEEGSAKVTDFGIARTLEEEGLTADGRVLGTTDYVSPEQALGQPVTGQSDLYSLGVVLYEMLTGEVPFKGENQVAVAMKHVREQMPDVQRKRPEVSAALAAVLDTATAKRQRDRYANDAELIADLEDVLAIETARAGSADRRGHDRPADAARADPAPDPVRGPPPHRRPCSRRSRCCSSARRRRGLAARPAPTTGPGISRPRRRQRRADQVQLCPTCAHGFNPLGSPTDEHPSAPLVVDNDPTHGLDDPALHRRQPRQGRGRDLRRCEPGVEARGRCRSGPRRRAGPRRSTPATTRRRSRRRARLRTGPQVGQRGEGLRDAAASRSAPAAPSIATTWCGSPISAATSRSRSARSRCTVIRGRPARPSEAERRARPRGARARAGPAGRAARDTPTPLASNSDANTLVGGEPGHRVELVDEHRSPSTKKSTRARPAQSDRREASQRQLAHPLAGRRARSGPGRRAPSRPACTWPRSRTSRPRRRR